METLNVFVGKEFHHAVAVRNQGTHLLDLQIIVQPKCTKLRSLRASYTTGGFAPNEVACVILQFAPVESAGIAEADIVFLEGGVEKCRTFLRVTVNELVLTGSGGPPTAVPPAASSVGRVAGMAPGDILNKRLPFIKLQDMEGTARWVVNPTTAQGLSELPPMPVRPIIIVGPYRSGKSFLLNKIISLCKGIERAPEFFKVGGSVKGETRGIDIFILQMTEEYIIVMDSEGLFDVKGGNEAVDAVILTLSNLLPSVLVFNVKQSLDASLFHTLSMAGDCALQIKGDLGEEQAPISPHFVCVIRDFFLEKSVSDKDYMESILLSPKKVKDIGKAYQLKDMFKQRDCFTMPNPDMDNNGKVRSEKFEEKLLECAKALISRASPKQIGQSSTDVCNNQMWVELAQLAVKYCNRIEVPNMFDAVKEQSNRIAKEAAMMGFEKTMKAIKLPLEAEELVTLFEQAWHAATQSFRARKLGSASLEGKEEKQILWSDMNANASRKYCSDIVSGVLKNAHQMLRDGKHIEEILEQYDSCSRGPHKFTERDRLSGELRKESASIELDRKLIQRAQSEREQAEKKLLEEERNRTLKEREVQNQLLAAQERKNKFEKDIADQRAELTRKEAEALKAVQEAEAKAAKEEEDRLQKQREDERLQAERKLAELRAATNTLAHQARNEESNLSSTLSSLQQQINAM